MRRLVIVGAGGHGKVVADIAKLDGYEDIIFLDDNENIKKCGNYNVVGSISDVKEYKGYDFFVAIGSSVIRKRIQDKLENLTTLIHPNAIIAENVSIGQGSVVMAGTVINSDTVIGCGCIVNTCASIDHDCRVEDFVHCSVGSHICGTVCIGHSTCVGAGAIIINNIDICPECVIGAGAVVTKNIDCRGVYIGLPARLYCEK